MAKKKTQWTDNGLKIVTEGQGKAIKLKEEPPEEKEIKEDEKKPL